MNKIDKSVASTIRKTRCQRGFDQKKLADMIGATRTTISNIENGRQSVSLSMFCKIADVFNKRPGEFLDEAVLAGSNSFLNISKYDVPDDKHRHAINKTIN